MEDAVKNELQIFTKLSSLEPCEFTKALRYDGYLPGFENTKIDFVKEYEKKLSRLSKCHHSRKPPDPFFR